MQYLAFDLGASSGRLMLADTAGGKMSLSQLHRFSNQPAAMGDFLYWDLPYLLSQMKEGLKIAAAKGVQPAAIGIDTWGVDYGYLSKDGSLLGLPLCYRGPHCRKGMEACPVPFEEFYETAGLQQMDFNTAYQFYYDAAFRPEIVEAADKVLFMPDLLNYFLTGESACEYTIASTSMLVDAKSRTWSKKLFDRIGYPMEKLPPIRQSGNVLGTLTQTVQKETGLGPVPVCLVGSHDTASALAGIPFTGKDQAFLSSGTWSLMGVEIDEPIISEASRRANFTNEGAVGGKIKYLKNISGLWMIQQLRRKWNADFPTMIKEAEEVLSDPSQKELVVDPDDAAFTAPADMEEAVKAFLKKHEGLSETEADSLTHGQVTACVYRGLTDRYQQVLESLRSLTGKELTTIHMVGGGIQDHLLCRMTMEKTGARVVCGPVEAAAMGNVLMQEMALGEIASLEEGRQQIGASCSLTIYEQ